MVYGAVCCAGGHGNGWAKCRHQKLEKSALSFFANHGACGWIGQAATLLRGRRGQFVIDVSVEGDSLQDEHDHDHDHGHGHGHGLGHQPGGHVEDMAMPSPVARLVKSVQSFQRLHTQGSGSVPLGTSRVRADNPYNATELLSSAVWDVDKMTPQTLALPLQSLGTSRPEVCHAMRLAMRHNIPIATKPFFVCVFPCFFIVRIGSCGSKQC